MGVTVAFKAGATGAGPCVVTDLAKGALGCGLTSGLTLVMGFDSVNAALGKDCAGTAKLGTGAGATLCTTGRVHHKYANRLIKTKINTAASRKAKLVGGLAATSTKPSLPMATVPAVNTADFSRLLPSGLTVGRVSKSRNILLITLMTSSP
jgi:hypothetical protein